MSAPEFFNIERSERRHSHGVVAKIYQVVGTAHYSWATNQDQFRTTGEYESLAAAQEAADDFIFMSGHACDSGCYRWQVLES